MARTETGDTRQMDGFCQCQPYRDRSLFSPPLFIRALIGQCNLSFSETMEMASAMTAAAKIGDASQKSAKCGGTFSRSVPVHFSLGGGGGIGQKCYTTDQGQSSYRFLIGIAVVILKMRRRGRSGRIETHALHFMLREFFPLTFPLYCNSSNSFWQQAAAAAVSSM